MLMAHLEVVTHLCRFKVVHKLNNNTRKLLRLRELSAVGAINIFHDSLCSRPFNHHILYIQRN